MFDSATLWTVSWPGSSVHGFSRQEYWSGLLCPSPGNLPDPGNEPASPEYPALQEDSFPLSQRKALIDVYAFIFPEHFFRFYINVMIRTSNWPSPIFLKRFFFFILVYILKWLGKSNYIPHFYDSCSKQYWI